MRLNLVDGCLESLVLVNLSCLGSRTPGVKDTPFLGSARGVTEAGDTFPESTSPSSSDLRTREQHRDTGSLPRFRPPGG